MAKRPLRILLPLDEVLNYERKLAIVRHDSVRNNRVKSSMVFNNATDQRKAYAALSHRKNYYLTTILKKKK